MGMIYVRQLISVSGTQNFLLHARQTIQSPVRNQRKACPILLDICWQLYTSIKRSFNLEIWHSTSDQYHILHRPFFYQQNIYSTRAHSNQDHRKQSITQPINQKLNRRRKITALICLRKKLPKGIRHQKEINR